MAFSNQEKSTGGLASTQSATDPTTRPVVPDDFDAIMAMLTVLVKDNPSGFASEWEASGDAHSLLSYHLEKGLGLVAEMDGSIVGHIGWRLGINRPPQLAIRYSKIESLFVLPDHRQDGLAKLLVHGYLAECRRQAIEDIRIDCLPDPETIHLFESLGFVEQRRQMAFVRQGQ